APEFHMSDRRRMALVELDRDQHLASLRFMFDMTSSRFLSEVLATRGELLALFRQRFEGSGGNVGPLDVEYLQLLESDERGDRRVALVCFDADALDAAYAELDARFAAGEGARYPARELWSRLARAVAARDWEGLASLFSPDFLIDDHRLIGWGTLRSGDEYVARVRALVDLRPDVGVRMHHLLALDHRVALTVHVSAGHESSGAFEIPCVVVTQVAPDGRFWRCDSYDLDQLDAARALYDRLRAKPPVPAIENVATRSVQHSNEVWDARDWERVAAIFASPAY